MVKAAEIPLSFDLISSSIDWNDYVHLRALLACNITEKYAGTFLKNYFDSTVNRWIPSSEVDKLLSELPSANFPETFRYMFTNLIRNWFKELHMYRDEQFDCNMFQMVSGNKFILMKYII